MPAFSGAGPRPPAAPGSARPSPSPLTRTSSVPSLRRAGRSARAGTFSTLLPEAYEVLGTRRADGHSQGPGLLLANPQDTTGKSGAPPPEARRLGSLGMAQPALLKPLVSS